MRMVGGGNLQKRETDAFRPQLVQECVQYADVRDTKKLRYLKGLSHVMDLDLMTCKVSSRPK